MISSAGRRDRRGQSIRQQGDTGAQGRSDLGIVLRLLRARKGVSPNHFLRAAVQPPMSFDDQRSAESSRYAVDFHPDADQRNAGVIGAPRQDDDVVAPPLDVLSKGGGNK